MTGATTASHVDLALDEIIKANRGKRGGMARGRALGKVRGIVKRSALGNRGRGQFQGRGQGWVPRGRGFPQLTTQNLRANMNPQQQSVGRPGPAKILIANLDQGVTDTDIHELFAEFGTINEAAIHYNSTGRSLSTAHVAFARHVDAIKAQKQYNGVNLDGRPMSITIEAAGSAGGRGGLAGRVSPVKRLQESGRVMRGAVGGRGGFNMNDAANYAGSQNRSYSYGVFGPVSNSPFRGTNRGRGGAPGRGGVVRGQAGARGMRGGRGGARGNRGGARGGRFEKKPTPTAAELDAELDQYLNENA